MVIDILWVFLRRFLYLIDLLEIGSCQEQKKGSKTQSVILVKAHLHLLMQTAYLFDMRVCEYVHITARQ